MPNIKRKNARLTCHDCGIELDKNIDPLRNGCFEGRCRICSTSRVLKIQVHKLSDNEFLKRYNSSLRVFKIYQEELSLRNKRHGK